MTVNSSRNPVYGFVKIDLPLKVTISILPFVLLAVTVSFASGRHGMGSKFYKPSYLVSI
jgi:hypothetical protein